MSDSGKRRQDDGAGGGRKKAKFFQNHKNTTGQAMPHGARGILVTCDAARERRAADEAIALIDEHFSKLQPSSEALKPQAEAGDATDISALIAAEVKDLKDKSKRRFLWHDTGVKGTVFILFPADQVKPTPGEVVISIMDEVKTTKTLRTRTCNRFLPITHVCYASMDEMKQLGPEVVKEHFLAGDDVTPIGFAVEFEHRAADKFDRLGVIDCFVTPVPKPPHKVQLNNPEKTILVQVCRNVCGCAVVDGYKKYAKYNVRKLLEDETNPQQQQVKKAPAPAAATDAAAAAPAPAATTEVPAPAATEAAAAPAADTEAAKPETAAVENPTA